MQGIAPGARAGIPPGREGFPGRESGADTAEHARTGRRNTSDGMEDGREPEERTLPNRSYWIAALRACHGIFLQNTER